MARNTDNQVENKGVKLVDILRKCGSIKQLQSAFKKMRELCTPCELNFVLRCCGDVMDVMFSECFGVEFHGPALVWGLGVFWVAGDGQG